MLRFVLSTLFVLAMTEGAAQELRRATKIVVVGNHGFVLETTIQSRDMKMVLPAGTTCSVHERATLKLDIVGAASGVATYAGSERRYGEECPNCARVIATLQTFRSLLKASELWSKQQETNFIRCLKDFKIGGC